VVQNVQAGQSQPKADQPLAELLHAGSIRSNRLTVNSPRCQTLKKKRSGLLLTVVKLGRRRLFKTQASVALNMYGQAFGGDLHALRA
jgi:hypothetical protein